jgi:hypothetical protein
VPPACIAGAEAFAAAAVTRDQMMVFISVTFGLSPYHP